MLVQSNSESSRQDEFQGEPAERTYLVREQRRDLQNSLISSFMNYSVKTYNYLIDYVLPQRCLSCSEILNSSGEFCGDCWQKLEFIAKPYCNICGQRFSVKILDNVVCGSCYSKKPSYNLARSLFKFNEYSKKVVHQFKYQDKTIVAKTFAKLLCNRYLEDIKDVDLIIAVPMNRFKRLLRMYNPPQILAEEVAKIMNITVKADILIKSKWTKAQTFLSKRQRKNNISGSIKFNTKYNILGKKILLIDDVITTGVTINECSKILRAAGAKEVKVVSVAMT